MRESTKPQNYLEERLTERAALAVWRLNRVAQHEAAVSAYQVLQLEQNLAKGASFGNAALAARFKDTLSIFLFGEDPTLLGRDIKARSEQEIELKIRTLDALGRCYELVADGEAVPELIANDLIGELLETSTAGAIVKAMTGRAMRKGEQDTLLEDEWDFQESELENLGHFTRSHWGDTATSELKAKAHIFKDKVKRASRLMERMHQAQEVARTLEALPSEGELTKITRYEAHLERTLYRSLHELEAARKEREGQTVLSPIRGLEKESDG
jgi:hypothetical protein